MNFKKAKWLIPALALLVIFESVMIVQRLDKGKEPISLPAKIEEEQGSALIAFKGESQASEEVEGMVEVAMTPLKSFLLDGVDVLIEYDPKYLEILGTDPSDRFSYLARNWVEPEKKRVLVSMLETELVEGVYFEAGEEVVLTTISYLPKKSGETSLKIIGGLDETGTVLAENGTAQKVPYSSTDFKLTIK